MERLILDTGVLFGLERGTVAVGDALPDDADDDRRTARHAMVEGIIERVEILDYDLNVARHHASLLAHVRRVGEPRGAHDLQIAATARAFDRAVITTDQAAFAALPGVSVRVIA